jgi:hypothetical protein
LLIVRVTTSRGRPGSRVRALGVPVPGELGVGLVDDDDGAICCGVGTLDDVERQRRAGGVVRRAQEDDVRVDRAHLRGDVVRVEVEVAGRRTPAAVDPRAAGAAADDRVHRVGRREAQGRAAGACKGLQQLLQHFVRPVRRPHLLRRQVVAEVDGQGLAQRRELAVGVAVERAHDMGHGLDDGDRDGLGDVVGVLVGVQAHRHVDLRRPVRSAAPQVVAQRQVVELDGEAHLVSLGTRGTA